MNEHTAINIIENQKEESVELQELLKPAINYAMKHGYTRTAAIRIFSEKWNEIYYSDIATEDDETQRTEGEVRIKAKRFLNANKEAFLNIEKNFQYYEDLFCTMYSILNCKKEVRLDELKKEFVRRGYKTRYYSIVPATVIFDLLNDLGKKIYVTYDGKIKTGNREYPNQKIILNEQFQQFRKQYLANDSKTNRVSLMVSWCLERQ